VFFREENIDTNSVGSEPVEAHEQFMEQQRHVGNDENRDIDVLLEHLNEEWVTNNKSVHENVSEVEVLEVAGPVQILDGMGVVTALPTTKVVGDDAGFQVDNLVTCSGGTESSSC